MPKKFQRFFIPQNDQSDCGVACLLMIIRYYGGWANYETIRTMAGTSVSGTTLLGIKLTAQKLQLSAEGYQGEISSLCNQQKPTILHVKIDKVLQHYVVWFSSTVGRDGKRYHHIGDPARGIISLTTAALEEIWETHACIVAEPASDFTKKDEALAARRQWIFELIKPDFTLLAAAAVLGVIIASLGVAMALYSQKLIDDILPRRDTRLLFLSTVGLALILLTKEALSLLRGKLLLRQTKTFNSRITEYFYSRLLTLPKWFFDTRKIGDMTARLNDTNRIQKVISQLVGSTIIDVLLISAASVFLFFY